ncbi:MAG TPA: hypothetical protein VGQ63_04185, partial [Pseudolabrys sp.]|nr:hypothetical protein [Pseudolabrys sp.]
MPFTVYHGYHLEWDDDVRRVRVLRKTDGKFVTYGLEHHTPEQAMEGARKLVDEFPDRKDVAWLSYHFHTGLNRNRAAAFHPQE